MRSIRVGGEFIDFHPDIALADGALLQEVLASCPGLELLDLWLCPGVGPAIVSKAAACCPLLTTICLGDTREPIEDAHLSELASGCPRLRCVKLFCCKAITDIGVACLLKHCTALEELDILSCAGVSDTFREMISVAYPHVRLVRMGHRSDGEAASGRCRDYENCHVHNSDAMAAARERESALKAALLARSPILERLRPRRR